VVSGESGVIINGSTATLPFVANKQLVGLAVTGEERVAGLPTFKEAGLPGGDAGTWQGILTTRRHPARHGHAPQCGDRQDPRDARHQGQDRRTGRRRPGRLTGRFLAWLKDATTRWGGIIREAGIKGS
jgi:hypothetical protein